MLGIDFAVWLAVLLSLGSAALCAVYGLARWNVDDVTRDAPSEEPPDGPGAGGRSRETEPA